MIYDFRCVACGWERSIKRADPPPPTWSLACADCADGKDVRWWRQRADAPFVPPESAAQTFGPKPWEYDMPPEERAARERMRLENLPKLPRLTELGEKEPTPPPPQTELKL